MKDVYEKEKALFREIAPQVEAGIQGIEVLALELVATARFCVYVDHPQGVDHALCGRVTDVLRGYLAEYSIDVSSPGSERPLRKPGHFERAVGRRVAVRTAAEIAGRKRFRGEIVAADERAIKLATEADEPVAIPYEAIVRGNLIQERSQ